MVIGASCDVRQAGQVGFAQYGRVRRCTRPQARRARLLRPSCSATPPERPETRSSSKDPGPPASSTSGSGPGPSLTDPVQTIYWGGTLPNTRRAALGALSGAAIALGGNLGGITSWLLGLDGGQLAGRLRADVLVPVKGSKRCVDYTYGFEFTYPSSWLGDQTLAYRAAKRAEAARGGLPPPGLRGGPFGNYPDNDDAAFPPLSAPSSYGRVGGGGGPAPSRPRPAVAVAEPVAAFGPPGTTGEENVSVIVAPIMPGFTLESLGDPRDAGERFLANLAPEGSGLQATLLRVTARTSVVASAAVAGPGQRRPAYLPEDDQQQQQLYYTLEYTVQGPRFYRHNVSVYTSRNDLLYTFNAQCPETRWTEDEEALLASAASFKLL